MLGFSFDKLVVVGIVAVFLVGPTRLPALAARLAQFVKMMRGLVDTAKDRVRDEMGDEFDEIDWKKLDPRQYDPRQIIRRALIEEEAPEPSRISAPAKEPEHQ
jgi:sec-independent protein translocase protein TatB